MSCGSIKRVLCITNPVKYGEIIIRDTNGNTITNTSQYSWSIDGVCWTNFVDYNIYNNICEKITGDYYLRVLFSGSFGNISINNILIDCYHIFLDNNRFELVDCNDSQFNFFDNINCAVQIQQQISDKIACLFGIPVYYFRVTPDSDTKDLTFKEYTLHDVEDIKLVKLILQDGTMPSSKPQFTEFDFDWEMDWEVEISKTNFALAFGETAFPKQRDFIYIPMMKRMYEVNSAYDEKEGMLMWQSTTFKLGLIKWNEKTNVDYSGFENIIDNWIENKYEDVFDLEGFEQEAESSTLQISQPKFIANNINVYLNDAIRYSLSENSFTDLDLTHEGMIVTKSAYKFRGNGVVNYQKKICGESGTVSFVIQLNNNKLEQDLIEFGEVKLYIYNINNKFTIKDTKGDGVELEPNNTYIVNYVWNRSNFTTEFYVYKYQIIEKYQNIPAYKLKSGMFEFVPYSQKTFMYNNDYIMTKQMDCKIYPGEFLLSNIKYYNNPLDLDTLKKECLKYTTTHENCVINDNAKPIETGFGSSPK